MPLLHACWEYKSRKCDCDGCQNQSYFDLRTTALTLQGKAKEGDIGPQFSEYTTPDWCCAYKYKLSSYTLSCEDAIACTD